MHHGIFIDLFPLDGYPAEPARQRRLERRKRHFRRALAAAFSGPPTVSRCFYRLLGSHRRSSSIAAAYERLITQYSPADSALLANHGNWQGARDYAPREEFGPGALAQFEQLPVRLPADYDAYLRRKYGDYWKDPPASRQVSHHSCLFLDTGPKEGKDEHSSNQLRLRRGSTGGITRDLHRFFLARGHRSAVLYGRGPKSREPFVTQVCPAWYAKIHGLGARLTGLAYGGCNRSTRVLTEYIDRIAPDVVHLQCINGHFCSLYGLLEF